MNKLIKDYKSLIDSRLEIVYPSGPKLLKEPINHILHGGKRIRPLLCMLVNDACSGKVEEVIDVAVSIELLHIFSLVHDDIMDGDQLRHGIKTIHEKWDNSIAILSGDAILALAFKGLNSCSNLIKQKFNSALIAVCEGQALDIEYQELDKISLNQYYNMINLKTGHMLGLSAEIGALISNESNHEVADSYKKMGLLIGKVFQIQDDLLEITSSSNAMGKSLSSDILLNKKTYLMIKAENSFPGSLDNIYKRYNKDLSILKNEIKNFLLDNKIIEETVDYISDIFKEVDKILISNNQSNKNLIELVNFLRRRKV